jgi:hypothetical protein
MNQSGPARHRDLGRPTPTPRPGTRPISARPSRSKGVDSNGWRSACDGSGAPARGAGRGRRHPSLSHAGSLVSARHARAGARVEGQLGGLYLLVSDSSNGPERPASTWGASRMAPVVDENTGHVAGEESRRTTMLVLPPCSRSGSATLLHSAHRPRLGTLENQLFSTIPSDYMSY